MAKSSAPAFLTTAEAAQRLGITTSGVRKLVARKRLPAERFGRDIQIRAADLALVAGRKRGRPKKASGGKTGEEYSNNYSERP